MTSFSIIIPSYGQQEFLPDAIESAIDQTFAAKEIIVIDDGSPDLSTEMAERYARWHSTIRVVKQVNKGLASARNTGIMNATGEYIFPLDADDELMPTCLEKIAAAINETHADIVAPSFKNFGVLNNPVILGGQLSFQDFKEANRLPYFCAIKREALLECGGYSPRMAKGYEDYHLWFDLLGRGKTLCMLQEILVLYRTKANSMLTEANKHRGELLGQIAKDFPSIWSR